MSSVAINLPESVVQRAMAITGKRTARAAVIAALADQGNVPNAETARILRANARSKSRGTVINNAEEFQKYLDSI